eukprot:1640344-Alexandrium_andersonii.AAC.1
MAAVEAEPQPKQQREQGQQPELRPTHVRRRSCGRSCAAAGAAGKEQAAAGAAANAHPRNAAGESSWRGASPEHPTAAK